MWSASAGDQFASLFYALIQPDSGCVEFASAGHIYAAVVGERVRPLPTDDGFALGSQPDADYPPRPEQLAADDALVIVSEGVRRLLKPGKGHLLWRYIQRHRHLSAHDMVGRVQGYLEQQSRDDRAEDRTIVIAKRNRAG